MLLTENVLMMHFKKNENVFYTALYGYLISTHMYTPFRYFAIF
jgi:hypothetical protein